MRSLFTFRCDHVTLLLTLLFDRYDARLLLDVLPLPYSSSHSFPDSPASGWSDLPSDSEDTFFFTPDEAEDYRRDKRRRTIALNREKRLEALRAERGEDEPEEEEIWGGSDEEACIMISLTVWETETVIYLCSSQTSQKKSSCDGQQLIFYLRRTRPSLRCVYWPIMERINGLHF